jgi:hypothetical protein
MLGSGILAGTGDLDATDLASHIRIIGNQIKSITGGNGVFILGSTSAATYGSSDFIVANNDIDVSSVGDVGVEIGISSQRAVVSGNNITVSGSGKTGILARSSKNVRIGSNTVTSLDNGSSQIGIYVWFNSGDNTVFANVGVADNTVTGFSGTSASGIAWSASAGASDDLKIGPNLSFGNTKNYDAKTGNITNLDATPIIARGTATLSGGSQTATVAFSGTSNYTCTGTDQTAASAVKIVNTSATQITITGTGTDVIAYSCGGY